MVDKRKIGNIQEIIDALKHDFDILEDKEQELDVQDLRECLSNMVFVLIELFKGAKINFDKKKVVKKNIIEGMFA